MRRALLSVTDKQGIVEFARGLRDLGFGLLSTGGTRRTLLHAGVEATEVADYTGFPELLDGRLKTLHPKVHGGLLGRREEPAHVAAMQEHSIDPIDLLCVNLYTFRETVRKPGIHRQEIVENIDIGGPAMIRSAAKNHHSVAVLVDPADYTEVLRTLEEHGGVLPPELRRKLAAKAFAYTASYDAHIAQWLDCERRSMPGESFFPSRVTFAGDKLQDLRYGENPHQHAALYGFGDLSPNLASARQLGGKELSYNNILDADAALAVVAEFAQPAVAIVKHNNPCGVAIAADAARAFVLAREGDPVSAFGGILACNRSMDAALAQAVVDSGTFLEVVVAPAVEPEALAILQQAKWGSAVRVLALGGMPDLTVRRRFVARPISGGFLLQTADFPAEAPRDQVMTKRAPSPAEREALAFAWLVCKHVKSNALVFARGEQAGEVRTTGIGAGQMSRVDAARIGVDKGGAAIRGSVVASDAFFPFADGLLVCAEAGVTAAIQPGGSKRDAEVVAAADEHKMAMVATGQRHFRH